MSLAEKFDYVMNYIKRIGGGEFVGFNNAVYLSERETADRNFAMGYYMKENNCFPKGFVLQECLDFYFQVTYFFSMYWFLSVITSCSKV